MAPYLKNGAIRLRGGATFLETGVIKSYSQEFWLRSAFSLSPGL